MANTVKHGKGSKVFIGDYDFSGQGRSLDLTVFQADMADATVFTSPARVKSPGSYSAKVDHKGIFNNAVSGWDNWLVGKLADSSGQPISILLGEPAEGDIAYEGEVKIANVKKVVSINDVIAVEASYQIHRALARGNAIAYRVGSSYAAISTNGVLLGPFAANERLQATVHIISHRNSGAYTVALQHSSNDSVYTTILEAEKLVTGGNSGDIASKVIRIPGLVNDYIRVIGTQQALTNPLCEFVVVAGKVHISE